MVTETTAHVARRVDAARRTQGVAILPLSEATGIPRSTLSRFLAGKADLRLSHLYLIARELKADASSWMSDAEDAA